MLSSRELFSSTRCTWGAKYVQVHVVMWIFGYAPHHGLHSERVLRPNVSRLAVAGLLYVERDELKTLYYVEMNSKTKSGVPCIDRVTMYVYRKEAVRLFC